MNFLSTSQVNTGDTLYAISSHEVEHDLCRMEMRYLFQKEVEGNYLITDVRIDPSRSPFIRHMISILFCASTLDELVEIINLKQVAFSKFKFVHFKLNEATNGYRDWIEAVTKIGNAINGESEFEKPEILLGALKIEETWIFGIYQRNNNEWMKHGSKPNNNSHSLGLNIARALINIAVGSSHSCRVVDPCCGVGTVVLEALSMDVKIAGFEINRKVYFKAVENITSFGFRNVINNIDMHLIEDHYDVAIVDLPYGLFTPFSVEAQKKLIRSARNITDKLILVSFSDMADSLFKAGFNVVDYCQINKGSCKRHVAVCV